MKHFAAVLTLATLLGGLMAPSWADVIHFHNGKVMQCKIKRVTGDIIDFKQGSSDTSAIYRMALTNRRDVVETDSQKYFGEIIYIDKFKVELMTANGRVKLPRLTVSNIVLGSPLQHPLNDFVETTRQQYLQPPAASTGQSTATMPDLSANPEPDTNQAMPPAMEPNYGNRLEIDDSPLPANE